MSKVCGCLILLAIFPASIRLDAQPAIPQLQAPIHTTTAAGFLAHVDSLRDLVRSCRTQTSACNPAKVGDDDRIEGDGSPYQVRWDWLRGLVDDSRDGSLRDRDKLLGEALTRLDEEQQGQAGNSSASPEYMNARTRADAILSGAEFRTVSGQSLWDREVAQFWRWFNSIFTGAAELSRRAPWVAQALEWGFIGLTIVAVLVWFQRTMQRQRLAVTLGGSTRTAAWQKESTDWADLARAQAERSDWREAVHCVYWASIVILEGRRLWRRNPARTPREYVVLLEPGSTQQTTLQSLTRIFERIWYGLRPAEHEDYLKALSLFEQLKTSERE